MRRWGFLPRIIATGEDLDKIARDYGLTTHRRVDEEGGITALRTGIPMETDDSLRKRILARIKGDDIIEGEIAHSEAEEAAREGGWVDGDYRGGE